MEQSFIRTYGGMILLAALGALLFFFLHPHVTPNASLNLQYSRAEILQRSNEFMASRSFNVGDFKQDGWFEFDGNTSSLSA